MISTAGMSPMLALTLIQRERETFETGVREDAVSKREISAFRERIGSVETVEDLIQDYETFTFVMKSFGMEDQTFAKAMVRKILTSDPDDKGSLVNKLSNSDYRDLNDAMKFQTDGSVEPGRFTKQSWVDGMVERYIDQRLIDVQGEHNYATGDGLNFLQDAPRMDSWYKVLANKDVSRVLRVALGMPEAIAKADVDSQKELFEKKMDITDLQDPEKLNSLLMRYAAIESANQATAAPSGIMSLFSQATTPGTWAPITIDISSVGNMKGYLR